MSIILSDYQTSYRSWEDIGKIANKARSQFGLAALPIDNMPDIIVRLVGREFKDGFILDISFFECNEGEKEARVRVDYDKKKIILFVDQEIWDFAKKNDPKANWILAHELGHIVLHREKLLSFSSTNEPRTKFVVEEMTTEWQADAFAYHFLMPDCLVHSINEPKELARYCNVEMNVAQMRIRNFSKRTNKQPKRYVGESCPECANFTLVRNGTCLKCDTCGSTTGCS